MKSTREKRCRKYMNINQSHKRDAIETILLTLVLILSLSPFSYGNPIEHLTLEEIVITDYALSETMSTWEAIVIMLIKMRRMNKNNINMTFSYMKS